MCCKTEIQTKVLSLKNSDFTKSFKTLHMPRNITAAQKCAQDFYKSDASAQTNQIKMTAFLHGTESIKKLFSQELKLETKLLGTFF